MKLTIALNVAIGVHKLVAVIFAVIFEIIIQRAVGDELCYLMKNTLIITVFYNTPGLNKFV
jgi:hypothetical protein